MSDHDDVFAILPVNQLSMAKTRLSSILSQKERAELVLSMLRDVLEALSGIPSIVVSPEDLEDELGSQGVEFLVEEEKRGLGPAVADASRYAREMGAEATLFIPVDTPLIKKSHVRDILALGRDHPFIITPSRRGGVGPIYRRPPDIVPDRFSAQSFRDFCAEAERRGVPVHVYESIELALDIDTPEDVEEFMAQGKGTRTYEYLIGRSLP